MDTSATKQEHTMDTFNHTIELPSIHSTILEASMSNHPLAALALERLAKKQAKLEREQRMAAEKESLEWLATMLEIYMPEPESHSSWESFSEGFEKLH